MLHATVVLGRGTQASNATRTYPEAHWKHAVVNMGVSTQFGMAE